MALRKGKTAGKQESRKQVGEIRRSQLITTYGVGAMIASDEQSYVVSGLDNWPDDQAVELQEFRLQTRLGIPRGFRLPPASDPPSGDGVRVRRFPEWYSCPGRSPGRETGCFENLRPYRRFGAAPGKNQCAGCDGALTPSRFVIACDAGHLDDFPYFRWVHARTEHSSHEGKHQLSLSTTGRTASLRSILVSCSCGKYASLEGAMGAGAMKAIGQFCSGARPWLGSGAGEQGCDRPLQVLQRGSSAAWLPVVRSALSIPPFSTGLYLRLRQFYDGLKGESDEIILRMGPRFPGLEDYSPGDILAAVRAYEDYEAGSAADPSMIFGFEAADVLREQEYRQLCRTSVVEDDNQFECTPPDDAHNVSLPGGVGQVMLVKRLREVRVLQSFTRVAGATAAEDEARLSDLSVSDLGWLPGIEVIGEGVFLRLDDERLSAWVRHAAARADVIRSRHQEVLDRRAAPGRPRSMSPVSARLVLIHTLAHALINEWSLDAGYPAASMRERLYVSDTMAGVLIYTATSDSAGSLGGLIGLGSHAALKRTLASAMERQSWCSADPLCMEAEAAGVDSLNLAACHSCILLPETSCEHGNSFLDRAMLVGGGGDDAVGYFR